MYWIAIGDIHEQTDMLEGIPGLREAEGVIVSGDITNRGTAGAAKKVLDAISQFNTNIIGVIGNMDTKAVAQELDARGANLHLKTRDLFPGSERARIGAFGVGYSAPTPFHTPSEVDESQLAEWLEMSWDMCMPYDRVVAVIHNPPQNTAADRLPDGRHVGSKAVRRFIKEHNPTVCITGHIHESRALDVLGQTTIINTGMLSHGGYATIRVSGSTVVATLEQA